MSKITFYPGPSRIYSNVTEYVYEAYKDGILSVNHRSEEFMELQKQTKKILRAKLSIPKEYEILFVSSATESWEIVSQSLVENSVQAFYNGAFGEKWAGYTHKLGKKVLDTPFDLDEKLPLDRLKSDAEWLFVTQNETSNGTAVSMEVLRKLQKKKSDEQLIAVDATSSMAGISLEYSLADIWFASVQKCFGLPAGMGVMIVSPAAIKRAEKINERDHYNSFLNVLHHHRNNQTHHTPNILGIYLLYRTLEMSKGIDYLDDKIIRRFNAWKQFIDELDSFDWLVKNEEVRSKTVLTLRCENPDKVKALAREADMILGNGYGDWKDSTIRIANFPAIKGKEIEKLTKFLRKYFD